MALTVNRWPRGVAAEFAPPPAPRLFETLVAALPGGVGVLARSYGLEVVGSRLTVFAPGVLALHELVLRTRAAA